MITEQIAGVDVRSLAEQFGTPAYVYDRRKIEERISDLNAFPVIRYAQKANSNLAILDVVRQRGVLLDAVSAGEIHRALKAGYKPSEIVYTSDIFDHETLKTVSQLGIHVNCGSPDMISQYGAVCPNRSITLRINPGFGHGHSQKTNTGGEQSKHGIWYEQLPECLSRAKSASLTITGMHMHIGSGTDFQHLSQVCSALEQAALQVGPTLTTISAGGGLPTPYAPDDKPIDIGAYSDLWLNTRRSLERKLGKKLSLEVEPGRYLVAEAGFLISEIRAVKQMGTNVFYLLNAGFNNLARPILYGAYHSMSICYSKGANSGHQPVVVGGPLCESGDIFTQSDGGFVQHRELPIAQVGDFVVVHCAGAYSFSMSSNYNSMPLACEILIDAGKPHLIRRRQTLDDLTGPEIIPCYESV
ncbi:diaminopimelate decarboxylase [Schlesneria paludicola]|uniref:diaminopimelate decarboxylase n=1 Tax=Schlesneria paludicola TaxID=360056 RepID=UPI00029ACD96